MGSITSNKTKQPWKITALSSDIAGKGSECTAKMLRVVLSITRLAEKIWTRQESQGLEGG